MSISSASGNTATVAADVCILPEDSVSGMRCTLCIPPSYFKSPKAPWPVIENDISLYPPIPMLYY
jgi:hypothetical protein